MLNTLIKCYVSFPLHSSPWIPKHCSNYYVLLSFLSKTMPHFQNLPKSSRNTHYSYSILIPFFFSYPFDYIPKTFNFLPFLIYLATLTNHLNTTKTTSFLSIWQVNVPPNLTNSETYHQTRNILLLNQIPF